MVAPSKIFRYPYNHFHCSQIILHPGIGCTRFFLNCFFGHYKAAFKYFIPLLISPLVMKYKTLNRDLFINIVKNYLQTVNCSSLAVTCTFLFVCVLRNILGRFSYYTTVFVPSLIGMQFCWFFPRRVLNLFTIATGQSAMEVVLRQYPNKFSHLILHSPMLQTILFMLNSAIILHFKRKNIFKDFWFIQPYEILNKPEILEDETEVINKGVPVNDGTSDYNGLNLKKCCHKNVSCLKFIMNGIKTYLVFGIPLDLLSMFMSGKVSNISQSLVSKVLGKLKTFRPNMTGFFITYVGLYRLSSCLLSKYYNNFSTDLQHLLSAFLGGLSFLCVKRLNFVTLSIVLSIQILWKQFCEDIDSTKIVRKPNMVLKLLKNVPFSELMFCINCSYIVHTSIVDHPVINSLARGFLDGLTCNKTKTIHYGMADSDPQTIVFEALLKPLKILL